MSAHEPKSLVLASYTNQGILIDVTGRPGIQKTHLEDHNARQRYTTVKGLVGMEVAVKVPDAFILTETVLVPQAVINNAAIWKTIDRAQGQVNLTYAQLECAEQGHPITVFLRQRAVNQEQVAVVQQMRAIAQVQPSVTTPKAAPKTTAKPRATNGQYVAAATQTQAVGQPVQTSLLTDEQVQAFAKAIAQALAQYK
jgi:hypothetical protein